MNIRVMTKDDIGRWLSLSREYDQYILDLGVELSTWYGENTYPFEQYMQAKIDKQEAYIALDKKDRTLGIIGFSRKNNRITFFGVSHISNYRHAGIGLMNIALDNLNNSQPITISHINSEARHLQAGMTLIKSYGFVEIGRVIEEGAPMILFEKSGSPEARM